MGAERALAGVDQRGVDTLDDLTPVLQAAIDDLIAKCAKARGRWTPYGSCRTALGP